MKNKNLSDAMKGNKNRVALKEPEIRQIAFKQYCDHIASGKAKQSWRFRHPDYPNYFCTWETMDTYIKENNAEFPSIQREAALIDGYYHWEQIVADSATGVNEKANTASLQMIMRNKFKWDKQEVAEQGKCSADDILKAIKKGS